MQKDFFDCVPLICILFPQCQIVSYALKKVFSHLDMLVESGDPLKTMTNSKQSSKFIFHFSKNVAPW